MRRSPRAGPWRPRPQTPRYACPFGRLASTSSVGAWTPCAASSAAVDALDLGSVVRQTHPPVLPYVALEPGRVRRRMWPQGRHGCPSLAELRVDVVASRAGTGLGGIAVAGVTVPCGRSSRTVNRQLSSRCAVVRMVATAGSSAACRRTASVRCRTMPLCGRRGRRQAGRPAATRYRWPITGNGRQQLRGVASRPRSRRGSGAPLRGLPGVRRPSSTGQTWSERPDRLHPAGPPGLSFGWSPTSCIPQLSSRQAAAVLVVADAFVSARTPPSGRGCPGPRLRSSVAAAAWPG